jgi:hypothetical protein
MKNKEVDNLWKYYNEILAQEDKTQDKYEKSRLTTIRLKIRSKISLIMTNEKSR